MGSLVRTVTSISVWRGLGDGIEFGVLDDGTTFMSQAAVAQLCGVSEAALSTWASSFSAASRRPRDRRIQTYLDDVRYDGPVYYAASQGSKTIKAYPEQVCMALLEYYAMWADNKSTKARRMYRELARVGMREFVHRLVGVKYEQTSPSAQALHDRLVLNQLPKGWFGVFQEGADVILHCDRAGLRMTPETVLDISIGRMWSTYWKKEGLEGKYGARREYPHQFPEDWPQGSEPRDAKIYPDSALPEFRDWLWNTYMPIHLPKYLRGKVRRKSLPQGTAEQIADALDKQWRELPEFDEGE